jgi:hypothetical protein
MSSSKKLESSKKKMVNNDNKSMDEVDCADIAQRLKKLEAFRKQIVNDDNKFMEEDNDIIIDFDGESKDLYTRDNLEDLVEIYKITNKINNKAYVGKVNMLEKHGEKKATVYGCVKRFSRHITNAFSDHVTNCVDCPEFYEAIRTYGKNAWKVKSLAIVSKSISKGFEKYYTLKYKTYLPEFGYNMIIGDSKALSGINRSKLALAHAKGNISRCQDNSLKKNKDNKELPPNITVKYGKGKKIRGYRVAMKIDVKYDKSFTKTLKYSMNELLEKAKSFKAALSDPIKRAIIREKMEAKQKAALEKKEAKKLRAQKRKEKIQQ